MVVECPVRYRSTRRRHRCPTAFWTTSRHVQRAQSSTVPPIAKYEATWKTKKEYESQGKLIADFRLETAQGAPSLLFEVPHLLLHLPFCQLGGKAAILETRGWSISCNRWKAHRRPPFVRLSLPTERQCFFAKSTKMLIQDLTRAAKQVRRGDVFQ